LTKSLEAPSHDVSETQLSSQFTAIVDPGIERVLSLNPRFLDKIQNVKRLKYAFSRHRVRFPATMCLLASQARSLAKRGGVA
jgi:hypothetical protein